MSVSLICNNTYMDGKKERKCGEVTPYMDQKTQQVFCPKCDKEVPNVSFFQKTTMKTLKQFKPKESIPFGVKCQKCHKESQPILKNDEILCPFCQKPHQHLTEAFKIMLKIELKTVNKEI